MALHHVDIPATDSQSGLIKGPWYRDMTRYHWFVLTVAALGWVFDCLDQQLFIHDGHHQPQTLADSQHVVGIEVEACGRVVHGPGRG